jgi:hypothetical protein
MGPGGEGFGRQARLKRPKMCIRGQALPGPVKGRRPLLKTFSADAGALTISDFQVSTR